MIVAIIPARGGSKRIPRKNIKNFNGRPIISWSIIAAQNSGLFDKVVVSTDDSEISKVAEVFGAEVPFILPRYLVQDIDTLEDWRRAEIMHEVIQKINREI